MGSASPALVGNAASFHMTNAVNPYQSNAACFHTRNAAQQGTSTAVDQHQWRWTPWGAYPCHPEPSIQAGSKRRRTESQPWDFDGTDEDDINPYLAESECRDLLSDSQSWYRFGFRARRAPAKRRCVPTKDTVKFLRSVVEKPLKNEKRKALANKFALPSCDPAHPPKLDESIVCLIPKTARSYNRFLSKLQQFSMNAMGPLNYLQEQMEAKTQVEGDTLNAALRCSLTLLGNAAAHVSVERRKCIVSRPWKVCSPRSVFPGVVAQSTSPRVATSIGAFLSQILRSQYSSTLAHKQVRFKSQTAGSSRSYQGNSKISKSPRPDISVPSWAASTCRPVSLGPIPTHLSILQDLDLLIPHPLVKQDSEPEFRTLTVRPSP